MCHLQLNFYNLRFAALQLCGALYVFVKTRKVLKKTGFMAVLSRLYGTVKLAAVLKFKRFSVADLDHELGGEGGGVLIYLPCWPFSLQSSPFFTPYPRSATDFDYALIKKRRARNCSP